MLFEFLTKKKCADCKNRFHKDELVSSLCPECKATFDKNEEIRLQNIQARLQKEREELAEYKRKFNAEYKEHLEKEEKKNNEFFEKNFRVYEAGTITRDPNLPEKYNTGGTDYLHNAVLKKSNVLSPDKLNLWKSAQSEWNCQECRGVFLNSGDFLDHPCQRDKSLPISKTWRLDGNTLTLKCDRYEERLNSTIKTGGLHDIRDGKSWGAYRLKLYQTHDDSRIDEIFKNSIPFVDCWMQKGDGWYVLTTKSTTDDEAKLFFYKAWIGFETKLKTNGLISHV